MYIVSGNVNWCKPQRKTVKGFLKKKKKNLIDSLLKTQKRLDVNHRKVIYVQSIKSGSIEMLMCSYMDPFTLVSVLTEIYSCI